MDLPCYCCGKPVRDDGAELYVVTVDGCRFMSHKDWVSLCESKSASPSDPSSKILLGSTGADWRPEVFGPSCYRKHKSIFKGKCVEVNGNDGAKYLFIDEK